MSDEADAVREAFREWTPSERGQMSAISTEVEQAVPGTSVFVYRRSFDPVTQAVLPIRRQCWVVSAEWDHDGRAYQMAFEAEQIEHLALRLTPWIEDIKRKRKAAS